MNKKQIAMRIKELRLERGLHQKEVAEVLGISQPAYCDLENGHTTFTAVALDKLANFYGLTLDEVLRSSQPVLNMQDHASNGYNVIHSQTVNGVSEEILKSMVSALVDHTSVLKDIQKQQAQMIDLLSKK